MPGNGTMPPGAMSQVNSAMMARRQVLRQFRRNTRRRWNMGSQTGPVTNLTSANQPFAFSVPQVGMCRAIYLYCDFLFAFAANPSSPTDTRKTRGPWNFINRLQCVTNLGSNNIWDTSGWGAFINNTTKDVANQYANFSTQIATASTYGQISNLSPMFPQGNGATDQYSGYPTFQYPNPADISTTASFAVRFVLRIDVSANEGLNFTQGMINLQAPQVTMTIQGNLGQATDIYGASGGQNINFVSGTITPYYEYYEIPSPLRQVPLPTGMLHCTLTDQQPFSSTGVVNYQIPRQGILLRLSQECIINAVPSGAGGVVGSGSNVGTAGIDTFELKLNNSDTIYSIPHWLQTYLQNNRYKFLPLGVYMHDFWSAMGLNARGDFRDCIDTEAVTTTQFNTWVNNSTSLGSNNNQFNFVREILVPYNTQATGQPNLPQAA